MTLTPSNIHRFQEIVWDHFAQYGRAMPWRDNYDPYYVMVSEIMLQQTQVARVIPKFELFVAEFPTIRSLADAPLSRVLQLWSGLGYNRRAKFLHEAAKVVMARGGQMPATLEELVTLPGIGPNTAGAIMNYAYNQPAVFVETNIRTVYLYHFFHDVADLVDDKVLRYLVEETMDTEQPRQWYWALMDYGAHLKQTVGGRLDQSRHYKKQSPLSGSMREMRGRIVKHLALAPTDETTLQKAVMGDERFCSALTSLQQEGLIEQMEGMWCLTGHRQAS